MAGSIPQAFIDQLLAQTDIAEVIDQYVPLTRRGKEHIACCPFHNEKTPSFKVNPQQGFFHCFGCGVGGNVISFLMKHQNLSFPEVVEMLAQRLGLEVPTDKGRNINTKQAARNKKIESLLQQVTDHYCKELARDERTKSYLIDRGLDGQTAKDFALGCAPASRGHLKQWLGEDYDEACLIEAGLMSPSDKGPDAYERFRERLIFPIRNRFGQTIAFGGRVLPGNEAPAKYINSPETPLFQKRNELYGLYELRQARDYDRIIVVEGYMDVVMLARHGIRNVVATLGTASTRTHIRKLLRITQHIVFCFDGDTAGQRAAIKAMEQALTAFTDGSAVDFMFLPSQHDPDSYVREHGADDFKQQVAQAQPIAEFIQQHYTQELDLNDPAASALLAKRITPILSSIPAGVFRDKMYERFAELIGIGVDHLKQQSGRTTSSSSTTTSFATPQPRMSTGQQTDGLLYSPSRRALSLLLHDLQLAETEIDVGELVRSPRKGAQLLAEIIKMIRQRQLTETSMVIEAYRDSEHQRVLLELLAHKDLIEDGETLRQEFEDALRHLKKDLANHELNQEIEQLSRAANQLDKEQARRLNELLRKKASIAS